MVAQPLPCPCCGNADIYVGAHCSDCEEVACLASGGGCGLRMLVSWEDETPEYLVASPFEGKDFVDGIRKHYQAIAIDRWNRRVALLTATRLTNGEPVITSLCKGTRKRRRT